MSLWRDRDVCAVCDGLVGYAGMRAARNPSRAHLVCKCEITEAVHAQGFVADERVHQARA